jgi:hypothetical protein
VPVVRRDSARYEPARSGGASEEPRRAIRSRRGHQRRTRRLLFRAWAGSRHAPGRWFGRATVVMKIELLYFDVCSNVRPTMERLKAVLAERGLDERIMLVRVDSRATAQSNRFLGSPTVRINGVDIEPSARSRTDFGLACRRYDGSGVPSEAVIRCAIAEVKDGIGTENWRPQDPLWSTDEDRRAYQRRSIPGR